MFGSVASIGDGECHNSGGRGVKGPLEDLKAFGVGNQIRKIGERSETHLRSGKAREIGVKAVKEPMNFVGVIDEPSDGVKLITQGLEGLGIFYNWFGAAFHQL